MRRCLTSLAFLGLLASSGCGTMFNAFGPQEFPHAYGGVELDCKALQATWSESQKPDEFRLAEKLFMTGLVTVDLPLCLVGDTLTLPGVLLQSGFQKSAWDLRKHYSQSESLPAVPPGQ
jgi:uncharacterized protein YceK